MSARLKLLTRIAQTAANTSTAPSTTVPASTTATTIAPAPSFVASQIWGWLSQSYNSVSITALNTMISTVNMGLHYASNGQFNFQTLYNSGFQVDISGAPSVDAKNLLSLSLLIYHTFLNSGNAFTKPPSPVQIKAFVDKISSSQPLMNLSQINPTGVIAQKMPGNLKDNILNYLRYLTSYNPIK